MKKKTSKIKKIAMKMFVLSPEKNLFFFEMFFYLPKLTVFFLEIGNNLMRTLGRIFFFLVMLGTNLMRALI